jgi:hypothetical protein
MFSDYRIKKKKKERSKAKDRHKIPTCFDHIKQYLSK